MRGVVHLVALDPLMSEIHLAPSVLGSALLLVAPLDIAAGDTWNFDFGNIEPLAGS
jgi:hypothetical protein